jgi:hypothetical protein
MTATAPESPSVSLNDDQRLFVLKCGDGYSCLGYQVVENYIQELMSRLGAPAVGAAPASEQVGSLARYEYYRQLFSQYAKKNDERTWFSAGTPAKLEHLLESLRKERTPVRLFYGDPQTGLDGMDCWDTVGTVGRTMGPMKSPLLVPKGDCGGGVISTNRVIKVVALASGWALYKHENYHVPELKIEASDMAGYPHRVTANGKTVANFKTTAKACNWLAFVSGEHNKVPF